MNRLVFALACAAAAAACTPNAPNNPVITYADGGPVDAPSGDVGPAPDLGDDAPAVTDGAPGDGGAGACTTSLDCPSGQQCERTSGRCVACLTQSDCAPGEVCAGYACGPATQCQSSRQCTEQVCDTARGACVDCVGDNDCAATEVCRANLCVTARPCQSSRQCNDRGQVCAPAAGICVDCLNDADCESGTYCATGGVCRRQLCAPNARLCLGPSRVQVCDARGASTSEVACGASQTCDEGNCRPWVCQPGVTVCGSLTERRTCNDDGLGFTTSACNAQEACADGRCQTRTCTAGATRCSATGLREVCSEDGLGFRPMPCTSSQTCRDGACLDRVCVPGQASCSASGARQVCNPDGLGFTTTSCESMQSCLSGVCRAWACTPGASSCADGRTVRVCAADGLSSSNRACGSMQTCSAGMCSGWVCVPGEATCPDATTRRVCNPDGLGYTSQACAARQTCSRGACEAWACAPDERTCEGTAGVRTCASDGLSSSVTACAARQSCTGGNCTAWVCTPAETSCASATEVQTCNADGLGYTRSTCTAPAHGSGAACASGACTFTCEAGYVPSAGACVALTPPRPIAPMSGSATGRRPTFRWENPPGVDGAVIQVCNNRECTALAVTYTATGESFTSTSDLPDARYWWRLYPRAGAVTGSTPSVVWGFTMSARGNTSGAGPDVNGDGYADVAVGAYNSRAVEIRLGSSTGVSSTAAQTLTSTSTYFGRNLAWVGDVNGDGYPDLAVGTYSSGYVYVYHGNGTGLATTPARTLSGSSNFGITLAGAGDVNGDGYSDLIVGSSNSSTTTTARAWVYYGSATGLPSTASVTISTADGYGAYVVAGLGDVNGDGYSDVATGSYSNRARVYYGSAAGLVTTTNTLLTGSASYFGYTLSSLGDANGDGYADLLVGSYTTSTSYNRVNVFNGGSTAIATTPSFGAVGSDSYFGYYVTGAGDVNGDGFADMVAAGNSVNRATLYYGAATGYSASRTATLTASGASTYFGRGMANIGDVNGDGYADVAVGDYYYNRVYVFLGGASGVTATPQTLTSTQGYFGYAVAAIN